MRCYKRAGRPIVVGTHPGPATGTASPSHLPAQATCRMCASMGGGRDHTSSGRRRVPRPATPTRGRGYRRRTPLEASTKATLARLGPLCCCQMCHNKRRHRKRQCTQQRDASESCHPRGNHEESQYGGPWAALSARKRRPTAQRPPMPMDCAQATVAALP